jgi:hypothetical protein
MKRCSSCQAEVQGSPKFCPECGKKFVPNAEPVAAGEDGVYFCHKHKRETTRVTCGRCERPICPKCMVLSAAGVRCTDCARNKVPVRLRGVLHDVGSGVTKSPGAQRVWYMVGIMFIVNLFLGMFGGRRS